MATRHRRLVDISVLELTAYVAACLLNVAVPLRGAGPVGLAALFPPAVAAIAFAWMLRYRTPETKPTRIATYCCAFVANQGVFVLSAVLTMASPELAAPAPMTIWQALNGASLAAVAVWTFYLVRRWVSRGIRTELPRRQAEHPLWQGAAATAIVLLCGPIAANWLLNVLAAGVDAHIGPYPLDGAIEGTFLPALFVLGTAGVVEEPVFVGVAVLLWPALRRRRFIWVAALTALARASIHLYYAAGAPSPATVVGLVVIWCAIWSSAYLYAVYRTRLLWPVVVAHGLVNALALAVVDWSGIDVLLAGMFAAAELMIIAALLVAAALYGVRELVRWRRRGITA